MPLTESPSTCGPDSTDMINKRKKKSGHTFLNLWHPTHLSDGQDGHSEDEGDGPRDHVEVGGPARQWLVSSAQGLEGRVPGVGQHDKPNHAWHQGVVHDDEDGDARQRLRRPARATTESFVHELLLLFQRRVEKKSDTLTMARQAA